MKYFLVVEPGFQEYKERIVKELRVANIPLVFATGLDSIIDYKWLEQYAKPEEIYKFDYRDLEHVTKICDYFSLKGVNLLGTTTLIDHSIPSVISIQHKSGLAIKCGNPNVINKWQVRELVNVKDAQYNPDYLKITKNTNLEKIKLNKEMIVKPTNMMASLGVKKISTTDQLKDYVQNYLEIDFKGENLRCIYPWIENACMLESYINGEEYSAETFFVNGVMTILGVSKKDVIEANELGDTFPIGFPTETSEKIKIFIERIHKAIDFRNGITHVEFKIDPERNIKLIEINPRIAGDYMLNLIKHHVPNIGEILYKASSGLNVTKEYGSKIPCHAFYEATPFESRVRSITEIDVPAISKALLVKEGDLLLKSEEKDLVRIYEGVVEGVEKKELYNFVLQEPSFVTANQIGKLYIFRADISDLDTICEIENKAWNKYHAASRDELKKRLLGENSYFYIAYDPVLSSPVGFIFAINLSVDLLEDQWDVLKSNYSKKPAKVDLVYIISISIPESSPYGVGQSFLKGFSDFTYKNRNVPVMYGMRISSYSRFALKNLPVDEYVEGAIKGKYVEPGIRASLRAGGEALKIIKDYYDDPESMNFAVLIKHN